MAAPKSGSAESPPVDRQARWIGLLGAWMIRLLRATVRLSHVSREAMAAREATGQPVIIAFWHRHLLLMPYCYRGAGIDILISRHRDGEMVAQAMERFGFGAVRGSSSRGGAAALRGALKSLRSGRDLAVTPDGPRGPLAEVKPGVIHAAARSGVPIQPVGLAASREKHLSSWDRFVIPYPFSKVALVYGEMMRVGRDDDVEEAARELQRRLNAAGAEAASRVRSDNRRAGERSPPREESR